MSILSVHDIQGISAYNNTVRIPAGHVFDVNGEFRIPTWTTATRPSSTEVGTFGYNTEIASVEVYTGSTNGWQSVGNPAADGTTQDLAVDAVKDILTVNPDAQTGWYWVKIGTQAYQFWIDTAFEGGGWTLVINNRAGNGGIGEIGYSNATTKVINSRGAYGSGNTPADFNLWVGLDAWDTIVDNNNLGRNVCEFVATSYRQLNDSANHTKRAKWTWTGWGPTYAWAGANNLTTQLGTPDPGLWTYHIANGYNLTAHDDDNDVYGSNCANLYGGHPWWFGACWSGNMWGSTSGSYQDAPFWNSSGSDYHNYGALYIK